VNEPDLVGSKIRRLGTMTAARGLWDSYWGQIGRLLLPRQEIFMRAGPIIEGERRTEKIFDSTAGLALQRYAAYVESMLTPAAQLWHDIRPLDPSLDGNFAIKTFCEGIRDVLFACRYAPSANFAGQSGEYYLSIGAFGTGGIYTDEDIGKSLRYHACNLSELYLQQNHQGKIDTVYRKFPMTARNALKKFGKENLPDQVVRDAESDKNPDKESDYLHCVEPNEEVNPGRADAAGMKFSSLYIAIEGKKLVEQGGYRTFPWMIGRHVTAPREVYGRSPAMEALPETKTLNEVRKTYLRQAERSLQPPLLLPDMADIEAFSLQPGALNYGAMSKEGRPLVAGLQSGAEFEVGDKVIDDSRKTINAHFYVDLFEILLEHPDMTATQTLEISQMRGALLAPTIGRAQEEYGTLIARELDLLERAGQFAHLQMPPELAARGGLMALKIGYTSPLNRAMRAGEAAGFLKTIEAIAPILQAQPKLLNLFDGEEVVRGMCDINNVPSKWLESPEDYAAKADAAAQAQTTAQLMQAAPGLAGAVKDIASAGATAGNVPQPQPGQGA
jgi:hypothetical protein